jgi:hypothetical protein
VRFVPDSFTPKSSDIDWAIEEFDISRKEVLRQLDLMRDHEFRRSYTDFNRVFRNWMRKADEIGKFEREHQPRRPEVVTDEKRKEDADKSIVEMEAYRRTK